MTFDHTDIRSLFSGCFFSISVSGHLPYRVPHGDCLSRWCGHLDPVISLGSHFTRAYETAAEKRIVTDQIGTLVEDANFNGCLRERVGRHVEGECLVPNWISTAFPGCCFLFLASFSFCYEVYFDERIYNESCDVTRYHWEKVKTLWLLTDYFFILR